MNSGTNIRLLMCIVGSFLLAQGYTQSFTVQWSKGPDRGIEPGSTQSLVAKVINTAPDSTLSIRAEFDIPEGWFGMSNVRQYISVKPLDTLSAIFRFHIPGSYKRLSVDVPFRFIDEEGNTAWSEAVVMEFAQIPSLEIQKVTGDNYMITGVPYTARFRLINSGNTPLDLGVESEPGIAFARDSLFLNPGESNIVEMSAKTNFELEKTIQKMFQFRWVPSRLDTVFNFYDRVEVFPGTGDLSPSYEKFPLSITGSYLTRNIDGRWESAFQGELFGQKELKRGGSLELHLRGPDRINYSTFGNYEEYYVRYRDRHLGLELGDQVFFLTRLTEFGRYSRGGSFEWKGEKANIAGFFGRPRFYPSVRSEFGLKSTFSKSKTFRWGGALLAKGYGAMDSTVYIPSVFIDFKENRTSVGSEIAAQRNEGRFDFSYYGNINTAIGGVRFNAVYLFASADFQGFYNNSTVINSHASYSLDDWTFSVNSNFQNSNPAIDTIYVSAPLSQNYSGIITYRFRERSFLRWNSGYRRRKDRLRLDLFDYSEIFGRISFFQNYSKFDFKVQSEMARTTNFKSVEERQSLGFNIGTFLNYSINNNLNISSNLNYYNNQRYDSEPFESLFFGGSVDWTLPDILRFYVSYQNNYSPEEYYLNQDFFELRLSTSWMPSHVISISGKYSKPRNQLRNLFFGSVNYTWTLGVPYKKKADLGSISGSLRKSDGTPLQGVILNLNGRKCESDSEGRYYFKNLREGEYVLFPDEMTVPGGYIAGKMIPLRLSVSKNEKITEDIPFLKSGNIRGKITLIRSNYRILERKVDTRQPFYIKISNENTEMIQLCHINGSFQFSNLCPGKWKVELLQKNVDAGMVFDQPEQYLDLKEDEVALIDFKGHGKSKSIKMIEQPIKISSNKE